MNECRPLYLGQEKLGDRYDKEDFFVFFGTRLCTESQMERCFPELRRVQNKQIHSGIVNTVDKNSHQILEGDALITQDKDLALTVYTADCLPVLIVDPLQKSIAAIHAGWKGLENQVIPNTLNALKPSRMDSLKIWIGPHIKLESFEVGIDVAVRLQNSAPLANCVFPHPTNSDKRLVDLAAIAMSQLQSCGVNPTQVWQHQADTLKDLSYPSFRRDGKGGRLLSFIALT